MNINDQVIVVTGGGSGLGAATAKHLHALGAKVLLADINATPGEALAKELSQRRKGSAVFCKTDVTVEADGINLIRRSGEMGELRAVVGCAGVVLGERVVGREAAHRLESFVRTININLIGAFNVARLAAEAMSKLPPMEGGERGVIINTASVAAYDGQIGQAAYSASKGGIVAMTLPMARELAKFGIRVMTIAPGIMETPMMAGMTEEVKTSLGAQVPFPARLGKPEEFSALVAHILDNVYLNGETIRLDGAIRLAAK